MATATPTVGRMKHRMGFNRGDDPCHRRRLSSRVLVLSRTLQQSYARRMPDLSTSQSTSCLMHACRVPASQIVRSPESGCRCQTYTEVDPLRRLAGLAFCDAALAFKATFARKRNGKPAAAGGFMENDVHASQHHVPLLTMELGDDFHSTARSRCLRLAH